MPTPTLERISRHVSCGAMIPIETAKDHLCVRCGACWSVCPRGILEWDERYYPKVALTEKECSQCGECSSVCPGRDIDLPGLHRRIFGEAYVPGDVLGLVDQAWNGHSTNDDIRTQGASGGVVTQLLMSLMEEGLIRKALVAHSCPAEPWKGEPFIASTPEEVAACSKSKYTPVPQMGKMAEILRSKEPVALVGLPCHIHAFRKYQARHPGQSENARLIIGLFCHMNLEIEATLRLLELAHIDSKNVEKIDYRHGPWPGKMVAILKNGDVRPLHGLDFKHGAMNYLKRLYYSDRCLLCVDHTAELSDVSMGDAWMDSIGRQGQTDFRGQTTILARTKAGREAIERVSSAGNIALEPVDIERLRSHFRGHRRHKKIGALLRIEARSSQGKAFPNYHVDGAFTAKDSLVEKGHALCRVLGRSAAGRRIGSRIAMSPIGQGLALVLSWRKRVFCGSK